MRLKNFIADTNISESAIDNCVNYYDRIRQEKIAQAQAIVKDSPESAISFQTKILERVSSVVQNNTIEELAEQGVISQSVFSQLL